MDDDTAMDILAYHLYKQGWFDSKSAYEDREGMSIGATEFNLPNGGCQIDDENNGVYLVWLAKDFKKLDPKDIKDPDVLKQFKRNNRPDLKVPGVGAAVIFDE